MFLHEDRDTFKELLEVAAAESGVRVEIVEKDYYVSMILGELSKCDSNIVFRGGTSLSKCYRLIDRFSEDIDVSVLPQAGKMTEGMKRRLKKNIVESIKRVDLKIVNLNDTRSRRDFNRYEAEYESIFPNQVLHPLIIIESFIALQPFPTKELSIDSFISQMLIANKREDLIDLYGLKKISMKVQTIERTFIDKIFAICDYYLTNQIEKHSRHIYDVYKILPNIIFDENFINLINEVRKIRKSLSHCPSANSTIPVSKYLQEIVEKDVYRKDYEQITRPLLYTIIEYDEAIKALKEIIKSNAFD